MIGRSGLVMMSCLCVMSSRGALASFSSTSIIAAHCFLQDAFSIDSDRRWYRGNGVVSFCSLWALLQFTDRVTFHVKHNHL